jgi:hypothetical protein
MIVFVIFVIAIAMAIIELFLCNRALCVAEDDAETGTLMKQQFEAYLVSLPNCVNRDLIDKAAIEFCMNFNTKHNRKKLVRGLFSVHRTRWVSLFGIFCSYQLRIDFVFVKCILTVNCYFSAIFQWYYLLCVGMTCCHFMLAWWQRYSPACLT